MRASCRKTVPFLRDVPPLRPSSRLPHLRSPNSAAWRTLKCCALEATTSPDARDCRQVQDHDSRRMVVVTKCDKDEKAAFLAQESSAGQLCFVSSRSGEGLESLRAELRRRVLSLRSNRSEVVGATAARCRESLRLASDCVDRARRVAASGQDDLAATDIRLALNELGRVTGAVYAEDVLEHIFSRFCIGK